MKKPCKKFDRHCLGGIEVALGAYPASIHKLIHRFLWISQMHYRMPWSAARRPMMHCGNLRRAGLA
jgi:hypothetical protein